MYGFQGNQKSPYLRITVTDPKHIARVRTKIKEGEANYKGLWKGVEGGILTFDNIQYVLRFMIDTKVSTQNTLPASISLMTLRLLACHGSLCQKPSTK